MEKAIKTINQSKASSKINPISQRILPLHLDLFNIKQIILVVIPVSVANMPHKATLKKVLNPWRIKTSLPWHG